MKMQILKHSSMKHKVYRIDGKPLNFLGAAAPGSADQQPDGTTQIEENGI